MIKNFATGVLALFLFVFGMAFVEVQFFPERAAARNAARLAAEAAESAKTLPQAASKTAEPRPVSEGAGLTDISLSALRWSKEGFGNVMQASFSVTNRNRYAVKDLEVTCVHAAPSGSLIDKNTRTVYMRVQPGGSIIVNDFNMGFINNQATSSRCGVTDFSRA